MTIHEVGKGDEQYVVEIRKYEGDEVVKTMGPMSKRKADSCARGAEINLDVENYYIKVRPVECTETEKPKSEDWTPPKW